MEALRIGALRRLAALALAGWALAGCTTGSSVTSTDRPSEVLLPTAAATPIAVSPRPLPECDYLDEPVLGDPDRDWATLVLDTVFTLPEDFEPKRLVGTRRAGLNDGYQVSRVMLDDLTALADAARADDAALAVQSAYRSYAYQARTFQGWVDQSSEGEARKVSARPGHSEHQLGTALDLRAADDPTPPWELDDFAKTRVGGWLVDHAWEYGFVMSYPRGERDETCYAYEPWHYRYVGRDVAAAIRESGLAPRRYLWEAWWAAAR